MPTKGLSRKHFIAGGLTMAAALIAGKYIPVYLHGRNHTMIGEIVGANAKAGHLLRGGFNFPEPSSTQAIPVVIVGGGISGLSAARSLSKAGNTDFVLLELGNKTGGNSIS
ncbi:MAG: NAD(P)-binding protein, partial [Bacteroidetes bacterium]|nr:NAD(P)-binding protein [Bacteroidota bacterium]